MTSNRSAHEPSNDFGGWAPPANAQELEERSRRIGIRRRVANLVHTVSLFAVTASSFVQGVANAQSAPAAGGLPTQGSIALGQATVTINGQTMTVEQATRQLGIDWQTFDIGAGNKVIFRQPDATSVAVNRVLGNARSEIFGNLQANGQVYLINPNGIIFGLGSQVDVGALVASTHKSATFDASGNVVLSGAGTGLVVNEGNIVTRDGGYVVLTGSSITNSGTISSTNGTVALAAGDSVTLSLDNGSLLNVKVDAPTLRALVDNKGLIVGNGGKVMLTAAGIDTLLSTAVNNDGMIQAQSIGTRNGQVVLTADGGDAISSGSIDVSGRNAGERGGAVVLGGNRVAMADGALIDASGVSGGGRVVIGGDMLGKASDVATIGVAERTVIGGGATIKVGSSQGDGGFVETSGKSLTMLGAVDTASAGGAGEWLIDPTDITINTAASTATNSSNVWADTGGNSSSVVNSGSIEAALNSGANVTITTNSSGTAGGNITVGANIIKSTTGAANLTLLADQGITVSGVTIGASNGTLGITMNAARAGGDGTVSLQGSNLQTNGANISVSGGSANSSLNGLSFSGTVTLNVGAGTASLAGTSGSG